MRPVLTPEVIALMVDRLDAVTAQLPGVDVLAALAAMSAGGESTSGLCPTELAAAGKPLHWPSIQSAASPSRFGRRVHII